MINGSMCGRTRASSPSQLFFNRSLKSYSDGVMTWMTYERKSSIVILKSFSNSVISYSLLHYPSRYIMLRLFFNDIMSNHISLKSFCFVDTFPWPTRSLDLSLIEHALEVGLQIFSAQNATDMEQQLMNACQHTSLSEVMNH
ncbi:hypothetical protein TNCV_3239151 [Trichonephila clavipes]|nr:hypothetical protein TNCV_3239151 [Trichonephila clavipes]